MDNEKENYFLDGDNQNKDNKKSEALKKNSENKPFYTKWWFWLIIGIVVLAIIGAIVGGTSDTSTDNDNGAMDNSDNSDSDTSYGNSDSDESETDTRFYIGDTVANDSDIAFKVTSVRNTKYIGSSYLGESTNNNFIVIDLSVINNGDDPYAVNPNDFTLESNGKSYTYHSATFYLDNGIIYTEVNPGITASFGIVFETPSTSEKAQYSMICQGSGWFSEDVKIILKSRA